jgi:arginine-tRNA-protein transferase
MERRLEIVELQRCRSAPDPCSYLPGEAASLDYRIIPELSPLAYQDLLSRGWRRFGWTFFRPACPACQECRGIRIVVDRFEPSRSQRRNWLRNSDLRVIVQPPTISRRHLDLYNQFHADMHSRKGWRPRHILRREYQATYLTGGGGCAREFLYLAGETLIAVGLADIVPEALSSVYCFYDPSWRDRGLGVFSVLTQLDYARRQGLTHQYLGYWVEECRSLVYKSQYRPHEFLAGYPPDDEPPRWLEPRWNS